MAIGNQYTTGYEVLTPEQRLVKKNNIEKVIFDSLVENDVFTYIWGSEGLGKSYLINNYATKAKMSVCSITGHRDMKPEDITFRKSESGKLIMSELFYYMQKPNTIIIIEELSKIPNEVMARLNAFTALGNGASETILDVSSGKPKQITISRAKNVKFVGTGNANLGMPGGNQYNNVQMTSDICSRIQQIHMPDECFLPKILSILCINDKYLAPLISVWEQVSREQSNVTNNASPRLAQQIIPMLIKGVPKQIIYETIMLDMMPNDMIQVDTFFGYQDSCTGALHKWISAKLEIKNPSPFPLTLPEDPEDYYDHLEDKNTTL